MQKQADFWLAICAKPDYLILDEPVDGLDPVMRRQIWSIILEDVAAHETTAVSYTHLLLSPSRRQLCRKRSPRPARPILPAATPI